MKQGSHGNLDHHVMGSNTLIFFFVFSRRSAFYRALLHSKTHTRAWDSGNKETLPQHNESSAADVLRNTRGALKQCIYFSGKKSGLVVTH